MKLRRGRGYRRGRIEIIPMIDVMFFLLVTFMLASLSMQSLNSITVNLPQGDAPNLQHKEPVALTITKDSKIFLDKTPTTLATMAFTLKSMLQGGPDKGVVVNADGAAPEGIVVEAMLQARRAGVEHFLIAVKRE
jgi:biopolymer transport protein ExbD